MSTATKRPFEIRGRHVLAAMLLFFGTVIAVNVGFAVIAVGSFPGEDVRRSYLQGVHYNDTLAQRRAQAALGWRAEAVAAVPVDGHARVEVMLSGANGEALDGLAVSGGLQWPMDSRRDRALVFEPRGGGRYVAALQDAPSGRWRLRAHAERGAEALDFEAELVWPTPR